MSYAYSKKLLDLITQYLFQKLEKLENYSKISVNNIEYTEKRKGKIVTEWDNIKFKTNKYEL